MVAEGKAEYYDCEKCGEQCVAENWTVEHFKVYGQTTILKDGKRMLECVEALAWGGMSGLMMNSAKIADQRGDDHWFRTDLEDAKEMEKLDQIRIQNGEEPLLYVDMTEDDYAYALMVHLKKKIPSPKIVSFSA